MAIIPGALSTIAQFPDGYTGLGHKASFQADSDITLLSTANDIHYFNISANRAVTLPSTDPDTKTVKQGRCFKFVNRSNFVLDIKASNGTSLTSAGGSGGLAAIRAGRVQVIALQDNPTTPAHWWVEEVVESGTWTPSITGSSGAYTGVVYVSQVGYYLRTEKAVFLYGLVVWSAATGGSVSFQINGAPYAAITLGGRSPIPTYLSNIDLGATTIQADLFIANASTSLRIAEVIDNSAAVVSGVAIATSAPFNKTIEFQGTYYID